MSSCASASVEIMLEGVLTQLPRLKQELDERSASKKRTFTQCYQSHDYGGSDSSSGAVFSRKQENDLKLLTIEAGKDVISEMSYYFDTFGTLYTEKVTGTVSCESLSCPCVDASNSVHNFKGESFTMMNLHRQTQGKDDPRIEDGLWVLLENKAGVVFWGKPLKPLIAETPVEVWFLG
ncbi:hypothetical protein R1sor_024615 [Riccia sorocarpa]|uniref:Uncharacterized protein n=1 Tax=Riccia sorocarpa TaxID=122646 RepID=A0ABD3GTG0_9MARC